MEHEKRIERLKAAHSDFMSGKKADFAPRAKRRPYNNPFILFAGVAVIVFIFVVLNRAYSGGGDSGGVDLSLGVAAPSSYVVFEGRVYSPYEAPVVASSLVYLGELYENGDLAGFDTVGFDLGLLYSIEGNDPASWLVVRFDGKFETLRYFCDVDELAAY